MCYTSSMGETHQLTMDRSITTIYALQFYVFKNMITNLYNAIMVFLIQTIRDGKGFCFVCVYACCLFWWGSINITLFLILRFSNNKPCD